MKPALAFLLLSACAYVVPDTAMQLAALDPLTADPAAIEVAVILPPGLAVIPGSAKLEVGSQRGSTQLSDSFALTDRAITPEIAVPEGATARVYSLPEAEAERLRAMQARIAAWKDTGRARGTLGLGIGGCATGAGPAADATGSVYIRLEPDSPFLPMIRNGRLSDLLGAEVMAAIEPCKGPG